VRYSGRLELTRDQRAVPVATMLDGKDLLTLRLALHDALWCAGYFGRGKHRKQAIERLARRMGVEL
jgi:hypothetical protein